MEENIIYLELIDKNHHKYYELKLINNTISINYGIIRRTEKLKVLRFQFPEDAKIYFQKQIQKKLKKGYLKTRKGLTPPRIKNIHPNQLAFIFDF